VQNQPTIAQESPHYNLITIPRWNYFWSIPKNIITAPNSDLNVTEGQTDRQCGIRQIIADIIGITDILSEKYRYIVDYKKTDMDHHYSLGLYTPTGTHVL